jgi:hypothetical protein
MLEAAQDSEIVAAVLARVDSMEAVPDPAAAGVCPVWAAVASAAEVAAVAALVAAAAVAAVVVVAAVAAAEGGNDHEQKKDANNAFKISWTKTSVRTRRCFGDLPRRDVFGTPGESTSEKPRAKR